MTAAEIDCQWFNQWIEDFEDVLFTIPISALWNDEDTFANKLLLKNAWQWFLEQLLAPRRKIVALCHAYKKLKGLGTMHNFMRRLG